MCHDVFVSKMRQRACSATEFVLLSIFFSVDRMCNDGHVVQGPKLGCSLASGKHDARNDNSAVIKMTGKQDKESRYAGRHSCTIQGQQQSWPTTRHSWNMDSGDISRDMLEMQRLDAARIVYPRWKDRRQRHQTPDNRHQQTETLAEDKPVLSITRVAQKRGRPGCSSKTEDRREASR